MCGPHFCSMKITEDVRRYAAELADLREVSVSPRGDLREVSVSPRGEPTEPTEPTAGGEPAATRRMEDEAIAAGMAEKSEEFRRSGLEIYR